MKQLCLISAFLIMSTLGKQKSSLPEQAHFDTEYEFSDYQIKRPVDLPKGALAVLRDDQRRVLPCAKSQGISPDIIPGDWFIASEIHLTHLTEQDFIVQPKFQPEMQPSNQCLFGANIGPFWVIRSTPKGHKLILQVNCHDLLILDSRTKGYRDIETLSEAAGMVYTVVYRFDGQKYEFHSETTRPVN